jgi:eukaryotic-like serine/threonine-protein kinase
VGSNPTPAAPTISCVRWPFQERDEDPAQPPEEEHEEAGPPHEDRESWKFEQGAPIADGRSIVKSLGGGSRYEVYLVWDDRLFSLMVAKILRPSASTDDRALYELQREAEMLERLAHPVIVRGFGAVLDGPHPHVLVEHLEGPTLRSLIKRHGWLPLEQVLPLALHVAAALHYMAAEDVVHLDVKPANIVMGVPPRLIDLSVARTLEQARRIDAPIGTDAYMAPEQCVPRPDGLGPAADVWGLGATLYHAVAGEVPFPREAGKGKDEDPTVRFPQLVIEPAPLRERVPAELAELIARMLAKDAPERPRAEEAAMALEPLVSELPRRFTVSRRGIRAR